MQITKMILWLFVGITTSSGYKAVAQTILQEYYKGDTTAMLKDANTLIASPDPVFKAPVQTSDKKDAVISKTNIPLMRTFSARDNTIINTYRYPSGANETIVFVHGLKSNASDYLQTASLLQEATGAEVYAVDLRGHGLSGGKLGDVSYINQYADDLADIVREIGREKPGGKIILAGHSMGAGIVLRLAMSNTPVKAGGYILFAPHIGHDSPSMVQSPPGKDAGEPFMQLNIQRIIGLKMLNETGRHDKDSLPVMFFNPAASTSLHTYTYRANMSMAPDNYKLGLKAVEAPLLVIIGEKDEAFDASLTSKAVKEYAKGTTKVVDGATHNSISVDTNAFSIIKNWYQQLL